MNTNLLLKKIISKKSNYAKNKLVEILAVDIENCHPIDFKDRKYIYKQHRDCLFLYTDDDYDIMAILKGSTHKNDFQRVENYSNYPKRYSDGVIKNRKHLKPKAKYILMFTPDMRTYHSKYGKHINKVKSKFEHRKKLKARLLEYKKQKYDNIDHTQTITMTKEVLNVLTNSLFTKNEIEIEKRIHNLTHFHHGVLEGIRSFSDLVINYKRYYKEIKNDPDEFNLKYYQPKVEEVKVKIIKWYNSVCV